MTAVIEQRAVVDAGPRVPQDLAAEQGVLASALMNRSVMGEILGTGITGRDFYQPKHELIWDAICSLDANGQPHDAVTVADELVRLGVAARAGGNVYLDTLVGNPSFMAWNGAEYARIVIGRAVLRRLVQAGQRITQLAEGAEVTGGSLDEIMTSAAAELAVVGSDATPMSVNAADAIDAILTLKDQGPCELTRGWRTGYLDLDKIVVPMQSQQFVIIAARPSVGKSVSVRDMARHMALRQGARVLLHSMEMSTDEVSVSLIAAEAGVLLKHLKDDTVALDQRERDRAADAYALFAGVYLHIDERESLSLQQLRASIRSHRPDVVFVDFVQLMRSGHRTESRYVEVSEIARGLKNLAKAEKVLIIGACQLKRDAANRRPEMADLKESGELEQAADSIIMIHRDEMQEKETVRAGEADFIVAKQRGGERNTATLAAQLHFGRFVDMAS